MDEFGLLCKEEKEVLFEYQLKTHRVTRFGTFKTC